MDWIAVGISADLRPAMAMPACIDGVDLAIWRSASGEVHAWGDRCPHRGMRLSHGFVRGETLSCIYHGWQFSQNGSCAKIPAHPDLVPPKSICATTYDCVEADGLIWVALHETQSKPPALPGMVPVRSLSMQASSRDVAAFFGDADAQILWVDAVAVVMQQTGPNSSVAHILTTQDRKQASRWIEAQRKLIEGVPA